MAHGWTPRSWGPALLAAALAALAGCSRHDSGAQAGPPAQSAPSADESLAACSDFGRDEAARRGACTAVIESNAAPSDTRAKAFNNRGVMRSQAGDRDGAIADYGEALRLDPKYPAAFYNRAQAWRAKGDAARADADAAQAVQLDPGLKGR